MGDVAMDDPLGNLWDSMGIYGIIQDDPWESMGITGLSYWEWPFWIAMFDEGKPLVLAIQECRERLKSRVGPPSLSVLHLFNNHYQYHFSITIMSHS